MTGALALALATALATSVDRPAQRLEVGFVSEAGVAVVVELSSRPAGKARVRSGSWVLAAGGQTWSGSVVDESAVLRPFAEPLPRAPVGMGVEYGPDGSLLVTLTKLGAWQEGVELEEIGGREHPTAPGVAASTEARLSVGPREGGGLERGARYEAPAVLYGTRGAITGRAWVDTRPAPATRVTALSKDGLVDVPSRAPDTFVLDVGTTCGKTTPRAITAAPQELSPVRLVATSDGGCLLSGAAVVPLAGAWLERRGDAPARAIAVLVDDGPRAALAP